MAISQMHATLSAMGVAAQGWGESPFYTHALLASARCRCVGGGGGSVLCGESGGTFGVPHCRHMFTSFFFSPQLAVRPRCCVKQRVRRATDEESTQLHGRACSVQVDESSDAAPRPSRRTCRKKKQRKSFT